MQSETHASHELIQLVMQLGAILIAARIGRMIALKIRLPGAIGELLIGIAVGPLILGAHGISPELEGICALAAIILLFGVGLETEIALLLRYSVAGALAGLGGVFVAYAAGAGAAVLCASMVLGESIGWMSPSALMLGGDRDCNLGGNHGAHSLRAEAPGLTGGSDHAGSSGH